ncbi:hypothetical protein ACTWPB_12020 [Nocardia sp. IBHARD005]|uniref:hypothetical protein n=1 Tax=Nocardia sp. IBHARD005 TaxID=3457765 RepID=UPI004059EF40
MPIERPQGAMFRYSQRAVDLLVYVVQQAVGEDFQAFAQRKLFDPLGIARSDYYWARDRAGNTYGHAHLILPPDDFAKLVLLVGNQGRWNSQQVISEDYLQLPRLPRRDAEGPVRGFATGMRHPGMHRDRPTNAGHPLMPGTDLWAPGRRSRILETTG